MKMDWQQILTDAILGKVINALIDDGFRVEVSDQDGGGLFVYAAANGGAKPRDGYNYWVRLTPENTGADFITDYTVNLEKTLKPVLEFAAQFTD